MRPSKASHTEKKIRRHQRRQALKFSLVLVVPLVVVMAGTLTWLKLTAPERPTVAETTTRKSIQPSPAVATETLAQTTPAIANSVIKPEPPPMEAPPTPSSPAKEQPQDLELHSIATALSQLNLDDNGQVKLDPQAKAALEAAFLQPQAPMDEVRFDDLKTLIEGGLQGEAGRHAAAVAERFYRYSNAYREVEDTFGYHGELGNLEANFEQLSRLRRTYLGDELTDALYGTEETLMRYTLKSMRIQSDQSLSPEQKRARQEELRKQVPTSLIGGSEQASTP